MNAHELDAYDCYNVISELFTPTDRRQWCAIGILLAILFVVIILLIVL